MYLMLKNKIVLLPNIAKFDVLFTHIFFSDPLIMVLGFLLLLLSLLS